MLRQMSKQTSRREVVLFQTCHHRRRHPSILEIWIHFLKRTLAACDGVSVDQIYLEKKYLDRNGSIPFQRLE